MARPLRIEFRGAWYHVMNRGLNRQAIFARVGEDCALFMATLGEACELFEVSVSSFCLMPNHYHLLVNTPEGNLARFMRHLNGVYTQRYNRKYKRDGPLFRGRYKGILVQDNACLLQVVKYIHLNPIKAGLAQSLDEYKWSSHSSFLKNNRAGDWLDIDKVLNLLASRRIRAQVAYKAFMREALEQGTEKFYSQKHQTPIFGDDFFVDKIQGERVDQDFSSGNEIAGKRKISGEKRIQKINNSVCRLLEVTVGDLLKSQRGKENIPRFMALSLAHDLSGLRLKEIADHYRINSYKTVSMACHRLKLILMKDKKKAQVYARLRETCSQVET